MGHTSEHEEPPANAGGGSLGGTLRLGMAATVTASGADGFIRAEPPHSLPLQPLTVSFQAQHLVDTVHWLCEQLQVHRGMIAPLDRRLQTFDESLRKSIAEVEERSEERCGVLERMLSSGQGPMTLISPITEDGGASSGRDLAATWTPSTGARPGSTNGRQLEVDVSNCQLQCKKLEQFIKHQEQQQLSRDTAQDEITKMEFARLSREIDSCLRAKDLDTMRSALLAKVERLELEMKDELNHITLQVKGVLHGQIDEIKTSMERITGSTDEQIRLINVEMDCNSKSDTARQEKSLKSFSHMSDQLDFLAQSMGIELPHIADSGGADAANMSNPASPLSGYGLSPLMSGAGPRGAGGLALERLERRLERLAQELGVVLDSEAGDNAAGEGGDGAVTEPGLPGLPSPGRVGKPQPLPLRVEKLEVQHEQLTAALTQNLGLVLPSSGGVSMDGMPMSANMGSGEGSGILWSPPVTHSSAAVLTAEPKVEQANAEGGRPASQALRLDAIENALRSLAVTLGVSIEAEGGWSSAEAGAGARAAVTTQSGRPVLKELEVANAKFSEVALALGLSPEDLESAALSGKAGRYAGRVILRDEHEAVSPRMAGMVASQEDKLTLVMGHVQGVADRLGQVEHVVGVGPGTGGSEVASSLAAAGASGSKAGRGKNGKDGKESRDGKDTTGSGDGGVGDDLEARVAKLEERIERVGGGGGRGFRKGENAGQETSQATDISGDLVSMAAGVRALKQAEEELSRRIDQLEAGRAALASAGAGGAASSAAPGAGAAASDVSEVLKRAEAAATAAESSARAAARLRMELEEIVRAVEVPSMGFGGTGADDMEMFQEEVGSQAGESDAEGGDGQGAPQYAERQMEMETRLQQLEDQLDGASILQPESEIIKSMKAVCKDTRRCLQRCELIFQLPEIKLFVKRFRKSLEVNAILHERWLGPDAVRKKSEEAQEKSEPPAASSESTKGLTKHADISRSAPDLARKGKAEAPGLKKGDSKKKPFRTVVDWCRPHTPLKLDPQFKGHGLGGSMLSPKPDASPRLPPIGR